MNNFSTLIVYFSGCEALKKLTVAFVNVTFLLVEIVSTILALKCHF